MVRPGVTVTTTSAASASSRLAASAAPVCSATAAARAGSTVVDEQFEPERGERFCRSRTVDTAAHHGDRAAAAERHRGEHGSRARPQSRHGTGVEHGLEHPGFGVGEHDEADDGGQPELGVSRKGRDPLEQRVAAAERGHSAKVPRRVVRHVELRLHRPFAAGVRDERLPYSLVRIGRRDRPAHVGAAEDRDAHWDFTAPISFTTDSFASPKSICVFGSR